MATYKVIQDIEAEDKLLGPLSLRQFIYAVIVVVLGFIMFRLFLVNPLLALPFLLPAIFFAMLAAPFGHDQSSEVWMLAKIRFFLKPRTRIWDQSGLQELVTITVPKKIEHVLTNGLNETQVKSRLEALAQTIDTRGWAVKGVDVNLYTNPSYIANQSSDRLLEPQAIAPAQVADVAITATDDILDTTNNPLAQHMDQLVRAADETHRQQIVQHMQQIRDTQTQPVASQPTNNVPTQPQIPAMPLPNTAQFTPQITPEDEQALLTKIHAEDNQDLAYGHTRILQTEAPAQKPIPTDTPPVTASSNPDILNLASNDDLSVATIARQVNKKDQSGNDEVVISLR
jgi:hypothetical protein